MEHKKILYGKIKGFLPGGGYLLIAAGHPDSNGCVFQFNGYTEFTGQ